MYVILYIPQVKNLEKMEFSDEEVMSLTLEIMEITYGKQLVMFCILVLCNLELKTVT